MSEKDVLMARFCDRVAGECKEIKVEDVEEDGDGGGKEKELVERVSEVAGDCCVPKKKG